MIPENKIRIQFTVKKEDAEAIYKAAENWDMTISQYINALIKADWERGATAMMIDFVEKGLDLNGTTEDLENV